MLDQNKEENHGAILSIEALKYPQQSSNPGNRINHTVAFYNDQIFIIGGTSASNSNQDDHYRVVHWYSLDNRQWLKKEFNHLIKTEEKEREKDREKDKEKEKDDEYYSHTTTRSFMGSCQRDHHLYLFGGSNGRHECNNELLLFNMKKHEWEFPKNENPPEPRESSSICFISESIPCLLMYGGLDVIEFEIYENFHFYNIETGIWKQVQETNTNSILRPRYLFSMCNIENKIYIFGGEFETAEGDLHYLNDMYELKLTPINQGPSYSVTNIYTSSAPLSNRNRGAPSLEIRIECELIREYGNSCANLGVKLGSLSQNSANNRQNQYSETKNEMVDENSNKNEGKEDEKNVGNSADCIPFSTRRRARAKTSGLYEHLEGVYDDSNENHKNSNRINNHHHETDFESVWPENRSGHKLLTINDEYLALIGGNNNEELNLSNAWLFSIKHRKWRRIEFDFSIPKQNGTEFCLAVLTEKNDKEKEVKDNRENGLPKREGRSSRDKDKERKEFENEGNSLVSNHIIYAYGGISSEENVRTELYSIKLESTIKPQEIKQSNTDEKQDKTKVILSKVFCIESLKKCNYCDYPEEKCYFPKSIIDGFTSMMSYPFTAVGLLLENASHFNSTYFSVGYRNQINSTSEKARLEQSLFSHSNSQSSIETAPFLHIIENNQMRNISYEDMKDIIGNFQYLLHFTYHNMEKKVKVTIQKEHQLREFGLYLKIGALRLGSEFIYISKGVKEEVRVFAFLLSDPDVNGLQHYEFCTYLYDLLNKKVIELIPQQNYEKCLPQSHKSQSIFTAVHPNSTYSYERINKKYQNYLEDIFSKYWPEDEHNHLLIFNLNRIQKSSLEMNFELIGRTDPTDICYSLYEGTKFNNPKFSEYSIDVSLATYMSAYFLKNEFPKMSIRFNNQERFIILQQCLEHYDSLVTQKFVYEVDNSTVNIEIKFMELYFNPSLINQIPFFENGVLFYHQGKLVTRYECALGDLYKKLNPKYQNFFSLFGLLEVPEAIHPNIFRTDFIFNAMMEKLRSRLKFIEKKLISIYTSQPEIYPIRGLGASFIASRDPNRDKTLKITKKTSLVKEKDRKEKEEKGTHKKDDTDFHPNKR